MDNSTVKLVQTVLVPASVRVMIVQILLAVFLYIDSLLIFTFFQKDFFRTSMRYIFFIHTLFGDWLSLCISNLLLILTFFETPMVVGMCFLLIVVMSVLTFTTPLTMVAMSLERYVAVCLPLRHGEISTVRRAVYCIFIIHGLSSIQILAVASVFIASVPLSFYATYKICQVEMLFVYKWQSYLRAAISQFYFLIMSCVILFTYIKIVTAVKKVASGNKTSASKGRNTVLLHGLQLFLCMFQFWTPFLEASLTDANININIFVRYFNYVTFLLAPRCLCPLVYGLRDEHFFLALKYYAFCGLRKKIAPKYSDI